MCVVPYSQPFGPKYYLSGARSVIASLKAPVYTAETSWKKLKVGVRIHVIR